MVTFWKLTKGFSWICDGSRWIVSTFCGYLASKPRLHQWLARAEWLSFWMKAERKTSKRDQLFDGAVDGKKEWAKFKEAEQTQAHTLEFSFSDMAMVQRAARTLQRDASASLVSRFGDYYSARDNRVRPTTVDELYPSYPWKKWLFRSHSLPRRYYSSFQTL